MKARRSDALIAPLPAPDWLSNDPDFRWMPRRHLHFRHVLYYYRADPLPFLQVHPRFLPRSITYTVEATHQCTANINRVQRPEGARMRYMTTYDMMETVRNANQW